jgi:hypothetical protein
LKYRDEDHEDANKTTTDGHSNYSSRPFAQICMYNIYYQYAPIHFYILVLSSCRQYDTCSLNDRRVLYVYEIASLVVVQSSAQQSFLTITTGPCQKTLVSSFLTFVVGNSGGFFRQEGQQKQIAKPLLQGIGSSTRSTLLFAPLAELQTETFCVVLWKKTIQIKPWRMQREHRDRRRWRKRKDV